MLGFLEAGGSFKAGDYCQSDLFPWKQPAGQLVPVNLRPAGASTPGGLLANSLEGGRNLGALLESLPAYCLLREFSEKGKSVNC